MPTWLTFILVGVIPAVFGIYFLHKAVRIGIIEDEIWDTYRVDSRRLFWLQIYCIGALIAGWVVLIAYLLYWRAPQP